jgi:hypothetical protein
MAVDPEEGGKQAHGRMPSALPVRAKTCRRTTTPEASPNIIPGSCPGRHRTTVFPLHRVKVGNNLSAVENGVYQLASHRFLLSFEF